MRWLRSSQPGNQFVDLLLPGGPAGDEADDGFPLAAGSPQLEGRILAEPVDFAVGQYEELLVGRRVDVLAVSLSEERLLEPPGRGDGLPCDAQIEFCLLYTSPSPRDA